MCATTHRRDSTKGEPERYCGLWVTMTHQRRFIECIKRPTLVWDVDGGGGRAGVGQGVNENSVLSA